jgi:spore coat protein CotH
MIKGQRKKIFIPILLLVSIVTAGVTGCAEGEANTSDNGPFYNDRVVTVYIVMSDKDWEYTYNNALQEQYVKADLWYDGEFIPDIAVRPKGNSSLSSAVKDGDARFSFKVDLNFFNSARNLNGVKKLNFNNGFSDPTLIRETLAYELYEQMDIPTPRTSFVDLWVNDTHLGLYTLVEQIDKTFISRNFSYNGGNLYKPEMAASYLNWTEEDLDQQQSTDSRKALYGETDTSGVNLGGGNLDEIMQALDPERNSNIEDPAQRFFPGNEFFQQNRETLPQGIQPPENMAPPSGFQPRQGIPQGGMMIQGGPMMRNMGGDLLEQMGLKTNENNADHTLLFRLLDVLNNEPDETFPDEIEKILDVDETLRFIAVSTLIVHLDNYIGMGHNYYLYENNGKFVVIPWDMNMAFGTFNSGLDREGIVNYYIDEPTAGSMADRPLVNRLLSYQPYLDTYHGYLEELLDGPFDIDTMNNRIDELTTLIYSYVINDDHKFFSTVQFERGLEEDLTEGRTGGGNPLGLKPFIEDRSTSVREQLAGIRKSGSGNGSGNGGTRMGGFGNQNRLFRQQVAPDNNTSDTYTSDE